jgi:phosphonate transport system permease protein
VTFEEQYAAYRRQKRWYAAGFFIVFLACLAAAWVTARFDPLVLLNGLPRTTEFLVKLVPPIGMSTFGADVREWYWDGAKWMDSLLSTLLMAYLATVLGTAIGGFLSFFAARNLAQHYVVYWVTRRVLEVARTVPDIVWALLFIIAFGIGPLAGILAIKVHTIGAQGKL